MRYDIVRLQVQTKPLKVGRAPFRRYDPSAIESVHRLEMSPSGVVGLAERLGSVIDVHHVDHPRSRDRKGHGGVSVMGTGDYMKLRARYGDHLTEGIAGESILVDAPDGLGGRDMPSNITVITPVGTITLTHFRVAEPCVEFSRFCLREEPSPVVDDLVKQALIDLDGGARGYKGVAAGCGVVGLADRVEIDW
jgi:hypothetical protein